MKKVWAQKQAGFTIVELLIVIVVIAILAAITIVSYNGIQNRAYDTSVQGDLSTVSKQLMMYRVEKGDVPKGPTQLATLKIKLATGAYSRGMFNGTNWYNLVYCWPNAANPETFALIAQSKSGNVFEAKNGSVKQVSYALGGSMQTCAAAGVTMDNGNNRDWFYDSDAWQAFVN